MQVDPAALDEMGRWEEALRNAASDMAKYERKDETILRLKRQRRVAIDIARRAIAALRTKDTPHAR